MPGENENVFNTTITLIDKSEIKDCDDDCIRFTIIVVNLIELKGKMFRYPPTVEMSVTDLKTRTDLGRVVGELEQTVFLNLNASNIGPFISGYIKLYMDGEMVFRLKYELRGVVEINGDEILSNF
jgi:hypothetical protein